MMDKTKLSAVERRILENQVALLNNVVCYHCGSANDPKIQAALEETHKLLRAAND